MSESDEAARLRRRLTARIAELTGLAPEHIAPDVPIRELGMSSRDAVVVAIEAGESAGRALPVGLLWEHPTIESLAAALAGEAGRVSPVEPGEPVAVVGIGCRLPGGIESPAALWRLLDRGEEAAGFPDVTGFDAAFFGIAAHEAAAMDPRERILLEVAWAALEHAGIPPGSLRGGRTGVFVGASADSVLANRLSDRLGVLGPGLVVDTGCSSSLVAVHQAVHALRTGDTELAIAGGIDLAGSRGAGCGIVLLKPLAGARRDGDRILALLRGSAINSNGMTTPDPETREQVLADACAAADCHPSTVDYVEAHGAGDPVEAYALAEVLGRGRDRRRPLLLGSVRTNLGHLGCAAGIAGLIKTVLALAHRRIPASPRFTESDPRFDFDRCGLRVVAAAAHWPRYSGTARAGVSAFGSDGTDAHVVLEEWARPLAPTLRTSRWGAHRHVFALSARTEDVLRRRAADLAGWLATPAAREVPPRELAAALVRRRDQLPVRAAVVASGRKELIGKLRALANGEPGPATRTGRAGGGAGPVFVFSGVGSQWPAMGRCLLTEEPDFRLAVEELEPLFLATAGFSLRKRLRDAHEPADPALVRPVLFGMQLALAGLWRAHGVEPAAVVGHAMGEVTAAVVTGALEPVDGLRIVLAGEVPDESRATGWFTDAVAAVLADGHRTFVEVSPHPIALDVVEKVAAAAGIADVVTLPSSTRDTARQHDFLVSLAELHVSGQPGALALRYPDAPVLELPPPPWRRTAVEPVPRSGTNFEIRWEQAETPADVPRGARSWLLLTDGDPDSLARSVSFAHALAAVGDRAFALPHDELGELPAVLGEPRAGVVLLIGSALEYELPDLARRLLCTITDLVRRLVEAASVPPRLYLATAPGAVVRAGEAGAPGLAFLRGLVRVLACEHPELHATLVELDEVSGVDALVRELCAGLPDDEVAWRRGARFVARLARVEPVPAAAPVVRDGAYVISGGLGRLGLATARWLAEHGARRIVLCGRSAPERDAGSALFAIRALGADVRVVRGDVAERGVAERLIEVARADGVAVRGVVHAAGVRGDRPAIDVGTRELARVWRPKVLGGWRLHEATVELELDWWLAFSSAAAMFGGRGQTAHATANAWLDALVRWRRGRGLPAATVNWGPWGETGGDAVLTPAEGVKALEAVLASGRVATGVARLDPARALPARPFFSDLPG
ncbi:type I polyketide synthase [Amycolatopsis anabasis]|uniref:type I polyketide synthase n=1 Tax=Amycolatopsis anabasis TaxID=1840409 RepID=UPI00131EA550|nr:type I polyketide synthase [Amycolatopsis anabasis]